MPTNQRDSSILQFLMQISFNPPENNFLYQNIRLRETFGVDGFKSLKYPVTVNKDCKKIHIEAVAKYYCLLRRKFWFQGEYK